jgi:NPCBM/NEW2 domain
LPPRAQILVVLANGGQLVTSADWSGGAAVQIKGSEVLVRSDIWEDVKLAKAAVSGIVFAQRKRADEREQMAEQLRRGSLTEQSVKKTNERSTDSVQLTNGDRLTGNVEAIEGGSVSIATSAGRAALPLSRVEAIRFGSMASGASSRQSASVEGGLLVGARDGSLLQARRVTSQSEKVTVEIDDGIKLTGGKVADIAVLQSLGGRFEYLSDIEKVDYRSVPYLSLEWPLTRDHNVLGGPLIVGGKRYIKGLGMHSAARLTFKFDRAYRRFDAEIALDDAAKGRGSVAFGVYVERGSRWTEAFKSNIVRGGESPQSVAVDLSGASGLTLTVDYADRGDELDYADWLDARLVR